MYLWGNMICCLGFVLKYYRKQNCWKSWVFVILPSPSLEMFENFMLMFKRKEGRKKERSLLKFSSILPSSIFYQSAHVPLSGIKENWLSSSVHVLLRRLEPLSLLPSQISSSQGPFGVELMVMASRTKHRKSVFWAAPRVRPPGPCTFWTLSWVSNSKHGLCPWHSWFQGQAGIGSPLKGRPPPTAVVGGSSLPSPHIDHLNPHQSPKRRILLALLQIRKERAQRGWSNLLKSHTLKWKSQARGARLWRSPRLGSWHSAVSSFVTSLPCSKPTNDLCHSSSKK